jgi:hypothetical protein
MQSGEYSLGQGAGQFGSEFFQRQFPQPRNASKFAEKFASGNFANSGNFSQRSAQTPGGSSLAVESDSKSMRFVPNLLDQLKHRRVAVKNDGLILAPEDIENFLFLRDAGHRLIDDLQFFQHLGRGVQLTNASVDQNQAGQRFTFLRAEPLRPRSPLLLE